MKPNKFFLQEPITKKQSIKIIDDFHRAYNKKNLKFSPPDFENLALRILPTKYKKADGTAPKLYQKVLKQYMYKLQEMKEFSNPTQHE